MLLQKDVVNLHLLVESAALHYLEININKVNYFLLSVELSSKRRIFASREVRDVKYVMI